MLILITNGTVREDNFHLPSQRIRYFNPLQVETISPRQTTSSPHLRPLRPSLFFKPRHEVKISMKRFFPRECNQKFRRSGPRRILNSSRRPAVQWRSRTAMKIILERSHVNKVSMKRKEERKYEKDEGKPSIYRKFGVSLTLRLADESN